MTPKEKLLDLIHEFGLCGYQINDLADYLLANGVVVLVDEPKNPPCWTCNHGWGSIDTNGYKGCEDSCQELRAYTSQLIAQEEAEAALNKMEENNEGNAKTCNRTAQFISSSGLHCKSDGSPKRSMEQTNPRNCRDHFAPFDSGD